MRDFIKDCHEIMEKLKDVPTEVKLAQLRKMGILDENNKLNPEYFDKIEKFSRAMDLDEE